MDRQKGGVKQIEASKYHGDICITARDATNCGTDDGLVKGPERLFIRRDHLQNFFLENNYWATRTTQLQKKKKNCKFVDEEPFTRWFAAAISHRLAMNRQFEICAPHTCNL